MARVLVTVVAVVALLAFARWLGLALDRWESWQDMRD
jgi:hypothetical protein